MRIGRVALASLWLLASPIGLAWGQATKAGPPRKYALLVGCTSYPGLDRARGLVGPAHDVELWNGVLTRFYGFVDADIVTLIDDPDEARRWPTLANIRRGFDDLARQARSGDQVVILLAGHGSQQPDLDDPPDEADGWDEIFLPRDVGGWNGQRQAVAGALVDDEIGQRLAAIAGTGASVWLIVDSCCSGTMYRGSGSSVSAGSTPGNSGFPRPDRPGSASGPEARARSVSVRAARRNAGGGGLLRRSGRRDDAGIALHRRRLDRVDPLRPVLIHLVRGSDARLGDDDRAGSNRAGGLDLPGLDATGPGEVRGPEPKLTDADARGVCRRPAGPGDRLAGLGAIGPLARL